MIGVTVLDGGAERLRKRYRRSEMEAVDGRFASGALFPDKRSAVKPVGEGVSAKIPGAEEIVFGTRSVDGWSGFTIHEKHVIAFAPPAILILKDGHGDSDKMSAARLVQPDAILLALEV